MGLSEFIRYQLGDNYNFIYKDIKKPSLLRYIDIENKYISNDLDIEKLKYTFDIHEIDIVMKKGDYLDTIVSGRELLSRGYYIISDESYEKLVEKNIDILNYIKREIL